MTLPRKFQFDASRPPWVHCTSRCVRKAFLCGGREGKWDHRRAWVEDRLRLLAGSFAVDVAGYAVMSNHLHVVVRMRPDATNGWSDSEVARRWLLAYPRSCAADGSPVAPSDDEIRAAAVSDRVGIWRQRLGDLGWFMKALKEPIARRANREDGCTGTFWEGRFHSMPLLDQPALIAAMAYVDLNPVRAKLADRPESSRHTAVRQRARTRNRHRAAQRITARTPDPVQAQRQLAAAGIAQVPTHAEDGLWVAPLATCVVGDPLLNRVVSADDYLTLVDATGRLLREGKRGRIDPGLAPILSRLDLTVEAWLATMCGWRMFAHGSAVGTAASRQSEATRKGLAWIKNRSPLFAGDARVA
jgi:hypothetical protein